MATVRTRRPRAARLAPALLSALLLLAPGVRAQVGSLITPASAPVPAPDQAGPGDLLGVVPAGTASVMTWRSGPDTARLESELGEVADALLEARFDRFLFDSLDRLGAPRELTQELAAIRNLMTTVSNVVPWSDLVSNEIVYAETPVPAMLPDTDAPSMLLACRPDPAQLEDIENGLAAVLGALAGTVGTSVRYDIEVDDQDTTIYEITLRSAGDPALLQVAVHGDTLLMGLGETYFRQALALTRGEPGPRLADTPRFRRAFGELGHDASGRSYLDVPMVLGGVEDSTSLLADHAFQAGFWPGLINDALQLGQSLDTVAGTVRCRGDRVVTASLTHFQGETSPVVRSGLPETARGGLLEFVPADATSLTMRGKVDIAPAFRFACDQFRRAWGPAADLLWMGEVTGAAMDLRIERDVLPWLGAEHVSMTLPSRRGGNGQDQVLLARLDDRAGARTCLNRIDGVLELTLPRLVGQLKEWTAGNEALQELDIQVTPAEGLFGNLKRLKVTGLQLPFPIPTLTYGLMGDLFVLTTSEDALQSCLAVAAGEEDGLWEHELLGELMLSDDLAGVSLVPTGRQLAEQAAMVRGLGGMVAGLFSSAASQAERQHRDQGRPGEPDGTLRAAADTVNGLVGRLADVLDTIDFLGDVVTVESSRDGGLARFETSTYQLLDPTGRWRAAAQDADTRDAVTSR